MTALSSPRMSNGKIATIIVGVVVAMVGLAFASVPLYDLFCRVTGISGTTQKVEANNAVVGDRLFQVRFDGNIDASLNWRFVPADTVKDLPIGETKIINYIAENLSDRITTGQATFNVTPLKAGKYFHKIECFCFSEQTLQPGERVEMPVQFYIDPAINDDKNMRDVKALTLSYTMYDFTEPSQPSPQN